MKVIKWFFVGLLVIVVSLALYLTFLFDLNDYKPELVSLVKDKTGRELKIDEDLKWTVYPSLGIEIEKLSLSAPKGFKNPMLSVHKAVAEVSFLPLLSKEVQVKRINLDGINLNLIDKKDGRSSLDGLSDKSVKSTSQKPISEDPVTESQGNLLNSLHINGISITDVNVNVTDEKKGVTNNFKVDHLSLDDFDLDKDSKLSFKLSAKINDNSIESSGSGVININQALSQFALKGLDVKTLVTGKALPNGQITNTVKLDAEVNTKAKKASLELHKFNIDDIKSAGLAKVSFGSRVPYINVSLNVENVDVTKLLPPPNGDSNEQNSAEKKTVNKTGVEPDLTALKSVNADVSFTVKKIQFKKIKTQNWNLIASLKNGLINVKDFSGQLYEGKLAASASLQKQGNNPSYKFTTTLKGVQVQPLLKDAAELDVLAGITRFHVSGYGSSLNPDNVLENVFAKGDVELVDGAIYGANIPLMIRNAKAKLKGQAPETVKEEKTDFTSLGTEFTFKKGIVRLDNTEMASPLIRLAGKGDANLVKKTVDYLLQAELVASLHGQSNKKDELSGLKIPLRIKGNIEDPKFSIDTKALLDQKIDKEKEKLKDKLKDKLFKKFGL